MLAAAGVLLKDELVAQLVQRTEGWPAALYLAALSLRDRAEPEDFVERFAGANPTDDLTASFARASARAETLVRADDAFAEWDSPETIDAVERALSALGDVVRLEATAEFPERLRVERPDIVFNMAEMTGNIWMTEFRGR